MRKTKIDIVGAMIQSIDQVYDYKQIVTDKGTISIYNPLKCYSTTGNEIELSEILERELENTVVTKIEFETEKYLRLELDYEIILEISLVRDDYYGPEAIIIDYKTGEIIVFE